MIIILAADHAGFTLKEKVKLFLQEKGHEVIDVGAHTLVDGDDYPIYMKAAAAKISQGKNKEDSAIVFGGSGQGEAMVCNRFTGVRADVWYGGNTDILIRSRKDNDANVLSIGARFVSEEEAKKGIELWLNTPFSGEERHARRIKHIESGILD